MKTRLPFLFCLLLILSGFLSEHLHSQNSNPVKPKTSSKDFVKQWKQVDSLYNAGLPKSAIEIVDRIYSRAKTEEDKPQYINSVIYRFKLQSDFREDILVKTVNDLKTEIKTAAEPVQQILNSILADVCRKYYQDNVYRFKDRTLVLNNKEDSIQTWDLTTISNNITSTYLLSLDNPSLLKNTPVSEYNDILSFPGIRGKGNAKQREL